MPADAPLLLLSTIDSLFYSVGSTGTLSMLGYKIDYGTTTNVSNFLLKLW